VQSFLIWLLPHQYQCSWCRFP